MGSWQFVPVVRDVVSMGRDRRPGDCSEHEKRCLCQVWGESDRRLCGPPRYSETDGLAAVSVPPVSLCVTVLIDQLDLVGKER
jgi:hypothetical protein